MAKRIIIVHGWGSNSREHWFLSEKERLEKLGYEVTVPDMPNTDNPQVDEWVNIIKDFGPDENSILIGHSLGGTTILRYLERTNRRVETCILIATPIFEIGYPEPDKFSKDGFDWDKIKDMANEFVILNQTKDPWVPTKHGEILAKNLGVDLTLVEGNDHFDTIDYNLIERNL